MTACRRNLNSNISFLFFLSLKFYLRELENIKTLNPSSILPLSKPSYSIRLHGPLLCPLQEPKLEEKR